MITDQDFGINISKMLLDYFKYTPYTLTYTLTPSPHLQTLSYGTSFLLYINSCYLDFLIIPCLIKVGVDRPKCRKLSRSCLVKKRTFGIIIMLLRIIRAKPPWSSYSVQLSAELRITSTCSSTLGQLYWLHRNIFVGKPEENLVFFHMLIKHSVYEKSC